MKKVDELTNVALAILQEQLEEFFPKLNEDDTSKRSPNHRSEAITFFAFVHMSIKSLVPKVVRLTQLDTISQLQKMCDEAENEGMRIILEEYRKKQLK